MALLPQREQMRRQACPCSHVRIRLQDEVMALSGGGDWHMAYLLLYRALKVPVYNPEEGRA